MKLMARTAHVMFSLAVISAPASAAAAVDDITNYREYSATFSSSGQPTAAQLADARDAGFSRVVYIAYSDHENSLVHEDRTAKNLGLEYVHIPVDWNAPTGSDFYLFAGAMQREPDKKTLLHCQVNFRASAFAFLYRVIYEDVAVSVAKADMNSVWTPNVAWTELILGVLRDEAVDPHCADCDWTPAQPNP